MSNSLEGQVAIVTGGSRGIGLAIAAALIQKGAHVAISGIKKDHLEQAEAELIRVAAGGARVLIFVADVRDHLAVQSLVDETARRQGGIDILVNNAGVGWFGSVESQGHDDWRRVMDTNVTGIFNCCKAAIPHLRQRGGGWIVNISSLSSTGPFPGGAAYVASKAGLNAFSDALMQELRDDNIRVTTVLPGSVATGFSGRAPGTGADWKLLPEDVAQAISDLLNHHARSLPSRIEIRPSRPKK